MNDSGLVQVQTGSKVKELEQNSLFNEISGAEGSGGIVGKIFTFFGDMAEKITGLDELNTDEQMV